MYQFISMFNSFLREEILPNPFESILNSEVLGILILALFGGGLLHIISFNMCGIFYNRGDAPVLGSIGYMVCYCINVWFLLKLGQWFNNIYLIFIIYLLGVIGIFSLLNKIREKLV